jgi:hypothetical protein
MKSTTRSGRIYQPALQEQPALGACEAISEENKAPRNVVTPEQIPSLHLKEEVKVDERFDSDEDCQRSFEYIVDCEANPPSQVLPLSASSFAYSIPSNESTVSPRFGGWQTNSPEEHTPPQPLKPWKLRSEPITEPKIIAGMTVPLLPGILRNSYGGIRDCLPPHQILSSNPTTPPPRQHNRSGPAHPFTALQLARIEENPQIALAKLRAQQP